MIVTMVDWQDELASLATGAWLHSVGYYVLMQSPGKRERKTAAFGEIIRLCDEREKNNDKGD